MSLSITDVVVDIPQGRLRGAVADGIASFKGVPYAAAPFGANRFRGAAAGAVLGRGTGCTGLRPDGT